MAAAKMRTITSQDRLRTRFLSLANVLAKTDRILSGNRGINVVISTTQKNGVNAVAFSDGKTITFNQNKITNFGSRATMVATLGANYHELAHLLFTPRKKKKQPNDLVSRIIAAKLYHYFNMLEDQRIETLFSALYKPATKYFTSMVVQFLIETATEEVLGGSFLLTHGRRYLPLDLRQALEKKFTGSASERDRAAAIIDEYRLLDLTGVETDPALINKVIRLVSDFAKLCQELQSSGFKNLNPHKCNSQDEGRPDEEVQGNAAEQAQQETAEQDAVEEMGEDGSGFWDEVEENDDNEPDGAQEASNTTTGDSDDSGTSNREDKEEDANSDVEKSERSSDSDSDKESDDDNDDETGNASGSRNASDGDDDGEEDYDSSESGVGGSGDVEVDLGDLLDEIEEVLDNSAQIQNDVTSFTNAVNDPKNFDLDKPSITGVSKVDATPEMIATALELNREFARLYAELEPGWRYGSESGRLNIQRAMDAGEDDFDIFDEWDEGREASAGLEFVVDVDLSGSMLLGSKLLHACMALWIIRRSLVGFDVRISGLSFDEITRTLFGRNQEVDTSQFDFYSDLGADTRPGESFNVSRRVLQESDMPNKLFVCLTDGEWSPANAETEYNNSGRTTMEFPEHGGPITIVAEDLPYLVTTIPAQRVLLNIGEIPHDTPVSSFHVSARIESALELVPVFRQAITNMLLELR